MSCLFPFYIQIILQVLAMHFLFLTHIFNIKMLMPLLLSAS